MGGAGGVQTPALSFTWNNLFLLLRYPNKLLLPQFFLVASGLLRGLLLLGSRPAEGLLAG